MIGPPLGNNVPSSGSGPQGLWKTRSKIPELGGKPTILPCSVSLELRRYDYQRTVSEYKEETRASSGELPLTTFCFYGWLIDDRTVLVCAF